MKQTVGKLWKVQERENIISRVIYLFTKKLLNAFKLISFKKWDKYTAYHKKTKGNKFSFSKFKWVTQYLYTFSFVISKLANKVVLSSSEMKAILCIPLNR